MAPIRIKMPAQWEVCVYLFKRLQFPVVVYFQSLALHQKAHVSTQSITYTWCMGQNAPKYPKKKKSERIKRWDNDKLASCSIHKSPSMGHNHHWPRLGAARHWRARRWHCKHIFIRAILSIINANEFIRFGFRTRSLLLCVRKTDRVFLENTGCLEMAQMSNVDVFREVWKELMHLVDMGLRLKMNMAELWHNWSWRGVEEQQFMGLLANISARRKYVIC